MITISIEPMNVTAVPNSLSTNPLNSTPTTKIPTATNHAHGER